ncbi:MAG: hypothetical protein OXK82_00515 [Deltaproteobacteria bacterium]|nr:hypothetical protein [Deltaproteobacteria bacterium]
MPIAFYCRAKPQECDAFVIFDQARRVFIGYPLVRRGEAYDSRALSTCLVSPTCLQEEWEAHTAGRSKREFTRNRNFVPCVTKGSIVVIPRPSEGAAYVARVTGPFEIVNAPPWTQAYLKLRMQLGLDCDDDSCYHTGDVAQGWPVDEYRRIDLSRVPGWLRRSFLGRSTYNQLPPHPLDSQITAFQVLEEILEGSPRLEAPWTLELDAIKKRLVDALNNPCAFENLVVELLQLENPGELWHHTGGPGDGGIDGVGSNEAGEVVGLMQAKYYAKTAPDLGSLTTVGRRPRCYTAVFLPENPEGPTDGSRLLCLDWIASAVQRHWRRLPLALTMRIGEGTR